MKPDTVSPTSVSRRWPEVVYSRVIPVLRVPYPNGVPNPAFDTRLAANFGVRN